jgi:hypothetical protein
MTIRSPPEMLRHSHAITVLTPDPIYFPCSFIASWLNQCVVILTFFVILNIIISVDVGLTVDVFSLQRNLFTNINQQSKSLSYCTTDFPSHRHKTSRVCLDVSIDLKNYGYWNPLQYVYI